MQGMQREVNFAKCIVVAMMTVDVILRSKWVNEFLVILLFHKMHGGVGVNEAEVVRDTQFYRLWRDRKLPCKWKTQTRSKHTALPEQDDAFVKWYYPTHTTRATNSVQFSVYSIWW